MTGACLLLGACGWTPRDEFIHDRTVTIHSRTGDGSELATNWKQRQSQHAQAGRASRFDED